MLVFVYPNWINGNVLFDKGVSVDLEKIEIVVRCPMPKDINDVMHFLELATYTRSM